MGLMNWKLYHVHRVNWGWRGEKPTQEEKTGILCQHPNCSERRLASK
ncbi:hypothetical protein cypCar_00002976, partial [Cyprinus carpio]